MAHTTDRNVMKCILHFQPFIQFAIYYLNQWRKWKFIQWLNVENCASKFEQNKTKKFKMLIRWKCSFYYNDNLAREKLLETLK